ncbi:MAG: DUF2249 domain-containing protein [Pseudomonadota bacterium]
MPDFIDLDCRGLEPPEPMEQALNAAAQLKTGQVLRLRIHREPFPLYELLDGLRLHHRTARLDSQDFLVHIERP